MKKQTIKLLRDKLAETEAKLLSAVNLSEARRVELRDLVNKADKADEEHRMNLSAMQGRIDGAIQAQHEAETVYDMHRKAVLHYFMAASNPETAKDMDGLKALQAEVCGLVPPREVMIGGRQPWERP